MEHSAQKILELGYASPRDEYAALYVRDRVARVYSPDTTGRAGRGDLVSLSGRTAMRFVCWNHLQCYGRLATSACNN